ncbi:MAG: RagB/SusD family nutrient uptake outer membrane protein, partial [Bacteroidales bacterium]|nr:RagB/SusD family nutrient uptake outer membrane protein [Bacteroidales bacterium]
EFNDEQFEQHKADPDYKAKMFHYHNFQFEVRALRAYFYFELVRMYGGVPLVTSNISPDEVCKLERMPADSIFKFIEDECVAIKDSIVEDYNKLVDEYGISMILDGKVEAGRVNDLFVLALRARAAVYHASPLFNPTNDRELWKQAVVTNQDLITACTTRTMKLQPDYAALFGPDNWTNTVECIFVRRNISASNSFERFNFPLGMENAVGANCPTRNLVEAYECTDGLSIDESPLYDSQNPGANRDSRLAKTVAVNGENWPSANSDALQTYTGGMHQADGVPYGTTTGYYLKKYVNGSTIIGGSKENASQHHWVIFRLAEFYLNYTEAILNYTGSGYEKEAFKWTAAEALNVVRKRAGQPDTPAGLSLEQFTKKYENERFVELAFEGHRFYDVRRWKKGAEYFTTIRKMTITKNGDGSLTFNPETLETRPWDEKMNLFPIAQGEILKSKLTQNPGW